MRLKRLSDPDPAYDRLTALSVLEAQLKGEAWFLNSIYDQIRDHLQIKGELTADRFPYLCNKAGHDHLINLAQFYFFLKALKCTTPEHIEAFIRDHNDKVETEIAKGPPKKRANELKRAIFKATRITQVTETFRRYNRPVFAISEVSHLAFEVLGSGTTTNLITDLLACGIFRDVVKFEGEPPMTTDPRRVLVEPVDGFVDTYGMSLMMSRQLILLQDT